MAKEDAAAPTVALESVFVTATIDAKEKREVVTIDIPGAFLHADNDDYVIMKMNGWLAELMVKTDPKMYRKYVMIEKGRQVLYLRLQKALYGMMKNRQPVKYAEHTPLLVLLAIPASNFEPWLNFPSTSMMTNCKSKTGCTSLQKM